MKLAIPAALFVSALVQIAHADPIYDQSNTIAPLVGLNIDPYAPIGQSFTPTLTGLNFVEVRLSDVTSTNSLGASFDVQIRNGATTVGPVLGTSQVISLPNGFGSSFPFGGSLVHFDFSTVVPLTPGNLYSFQVAKTDAGDGFFLYGRQTDTYAGGTAITVNSPISFEDFYFREGLNVPEPGSLTLLAIGAAGLLLWARFASFRVVEPHQTSHYNSR